MITKIYINWLMALTTCLLNGLFSSVNEKSKITSASQQLALDFQVIFEFSKKMKLYSVSQENFETFFQKGVMESYNFQQSSHYMNQSRLNRMIEKELSLYQDLKHPLKKLSKRDSKDLKSSEVLNTFSGEWYGKWKSMDVKHLWLPFKKTNLKIGKEFKIIGFQTCFIGDGFGWNYLIQKGEKIIILGYVYHFDEKGKLISENPHYAFVNNENQLTWVSDNHIYHEFVCEDAKCTNSKHYVITAISYTSTNGIKFGIPFQAIYLSGNNLMRSQKI